MPLKVVKVVTNPVSKMGFFKYFIYPQSLRKKSIHLSFNLMALSIFRNVTRMHKLLKESNYTYTYNILSLKGNNNFKKIYKNLTFDIHFVLPLDIQNSKIYVF